MKNIWGMIALGFLLFLSACSTLNPFSKEKAEDYNAITYGDESENRNRGGAWGLHNEAAPQMRNDNPYNRQNRSMASVEDEKQQKDSYYDNQKQDASDDEVRSKIESERGYASAGTYQRGDRATKSDFYDNAPSDGSLWANQNDANYFFTKDKLRASGDIISVKPDPALVRQVAEEIKKSLTPAEQEVEMALYLKNSNGAKNDKDLQAYRNVASEDLKTPEAEEVKTKMEKAVRWSQVDLGPAVGLTLNDEIRAEIVDRYQNGNYKIKATKRVLYRGSTKTISMVAVAPAADFDEKDTILAGKLYEYKVKVAR